MNDKTLALFLSMYSLILICSVLEKALFQELFRLRNGHLALPGGPARRLPAREAAALKLKGDRTKEIIFEEEKNQTNNMDELHTIFLTGNFI